MPHNRNAKKALRQNEKARLRNRAVRTTLKTLIRKAREAAAGTDVQAADAAYRLVARRLDQAAMKHYIHKNKASRLKSRLSQLLNKPKSPAATATPTT